MAGNEPRHEIFLVHGASDRAWVDGYLRPMLGLDPARVLTPRDFDLAGSVVDGFARAVESSRYTALVLSPSFLADDWAAFGQQLATFTAVEGTARFLIIRLHECELPLQLRYRVSLDCTDWELWDDRVAQLRALLEAPEPVLAEVPCPYPGMVPFLKEDARFFFGRDGEIHDLAARLRHHHLLFVIGSSGSGKSSLVSAGLMPRLDTPPGMWKALAMRPGPGPCDELARLLGGPADDPAAAIAGLLEAAPKAQQLLLVIDQFEELFTQTKDRAEQDRFLELLKRLRGDARCHLIATMRADFYGDLMNSALWPVEDSQQLKIAAPRGVALRAAIVRPAEAVGVFLEDGLVERLLADAADEPGMLPMLQEALALLWGQRKGRLLTRAAYDVLGRDGRSGLAVAMATKADATLAQLPPERQRIARRIFLRLVQFGEGRPDTRRQSEVDDLRSKGDDPVVFEQVLATLIDNRLLIPSQDEGRGQRVDISHEMLIAGWPASQEWARVRRAAEMTRRILAGKAAEWDRLGRGAGGLLDDAELAEASRWIDGPDAIDLGVDDDVQALVDASRTAIDHREREKDAQRQRELDQANDLATARGERIRVFRNALAGVGVLSAVLALVALYANQQRGKAEVQSLRAERGESEAKANAETARENERVALANEELARVEERKARAQGLAFRAIPFLIDESRDPQEALAYSLAAVRASSPVEQPAVTALSNSVQDNHLAALLGGHELGVEDFSWSPTGDHIATIDRRGRLRIWTPDGRQSGAEVELGVFSPSFGRGGVRTRPLGWSPDGLVLVAASGDRLRFHRVSLGGDAPRVLDFRSPIRSLGWSADGRTLAVLNEPEPAPTPPPAPPGDGAAAPPQAPPPWAQFRLFDSQGHWAGSPLATSYYAEDFAWNPVTTMLATCPPDNNPSVVLWPKAGAPTLSLAGHRAPVTHLLWSPDGEALVSIDRQGQMRVWERGSPAGEPLDLGSDVIHWAWSPDSQRLAFAVGYDVALPRIWSRKTRSASPNRTLAQINDLARKFYPQSGIIGISWDPRGDRVATQHADQVAFWSGDPEFLRAQPGRSIHWHPKSGSALTRPLSGPDPTIRLLNPDGREVSSFRGHENIPDRVSWSPDGRWAASAAQPPEKHVRIWDPSEEPMKTLDGPLESPGFPGSSPSLAWQPGGKTLAIGDRLGLRLRDAAGLPIPGPRSAGSTGGSFPGECLWSPDGRRFLFPPSRYGAPLLSLRDPSGEVVTIFEASHPAWNPVEPILATLAEDHVQVRDIDGTVAHQVEAPPNPQSLAWSPDGTLLAVAGVEWPRALTMPVAPMASPAVPPPSPPGPGEAASSPAPDRRPPRPGAPAVRPMASPTVRLHLWSKELTGKVEVSEPGQPIRRILWSPDGKALAATDDAAALWLWGSDGRLIRRISLPIDGLGPLAWSPDGAYLASVTGGTTSSAVFNPGRAPKSLDAVVLMWDRSGESVPAFRGKGHEGAVYFVGWAPTEGAHVLATAGAGRTIRLWTPRGNAGVLRGHDGPVFRVAWGPDGRRFASISADRSVRIWKTETAPDGRVRSEPLMTLAGPENRLPVVPSVSIPAMSAPGMAAPQMADPRIMAPETPPDYVLAWRPDGLGIASVSKDPYARLWTTDLAELYALGRRRLVRTDTTAADEPAAPMWDPLDPGELARQLADADPWARARAAHLLGRLGTGDVPDLSALFKALNDPESVVRAAAAGALGRHVPATDLIAMEALSLAIRDDASWSVRLSLVDGLSGRFEEPPKALIDAVAASVADDRLRPYATRLLGTAGEPALIALASGALSEDPERAYGSLRALDAIARSRGEGAGSGRVPPEVARALETAIGQGGDRQKAAAASAHLALLSRRSELVEPLRALLDSEDERARNLVMDVVEEMGETRGALTSAIARRLLDDSTHLRGRAQEILAVIGGAIAPPQGDGPGSAPRFPVAPIYRVDDQARALESLGPDLGPLMADLLTDERPGAASGLIRGLGDRAKAVVADALMPRLRAGGSSIAADAVASLATPLAERLGPLLDSPRAEDRSLAVGLASRLGPPLSGLKPRIEARLEDVEPGIRVGAAVALWRIDRQQAPKAVEAILGVLGQGDADVRRLAVASLASMEGAAGGSVASLATLAKDDPDATVREAARDAGQHIARILSQPPTPPRK